MKLYKSQLLGATMDITLKRIYFWGGIFSQWADREFFHPEMNATFNCAEQAMMAKKALVFKDFEIYDLIMKVKDPREHKALGRKIKNYDDEVWAEARLDVVKYINFLKFVQNPGWRELLILTDGYMLVEASPHDTIWGVGLGEDDPLILDRGNWRGTNLLGIAIMDARTKIINSLEK